MKIFARVRDTLEAKGEYVFVTLFALCFVAFAVIWLVVRHVHQQSTAPRAEQRFREQCVTTSTELEHMVAVLDPGHGGNDPGAIGTIPYRWRTIDVPEAPYAMDVVRRIAKHVECKGGVAVITRYNPSTLTSIITSPATDIQTKDLHDVFGGTTIPVTSTPSGLTVRTNIAQEVQKQYSKQCPVFVSVHFDIQGSRYQGPFILFPQNGNHELADFIITEMEMQQRLRYELKKGSYVALPRSASSRITNSSHVLNPSKNPIVQKVLIELGNLNNKDDLWRMRAPSVRESYAVAITNGILAYTHHYCVPRHDP